jgi:predicted choloylglycine hydrolase
VTTLPVTFRAVSEGGADDAFAARFAAVWPAYQAWFLQAGDAARPSYVTARTALREHLPELVPTWERLCRLAGGGDTASRVLAHWCPPPHLSGCTQAVVRRGDPILVRNYDYDVRSFDATILMTDYAGRRVLGTGDCVWGLLDGLNEDGLAATLTFGGSREVGTGFGISIVMRYLLETCTTVAQALGVLDRVPVHMAYNVTVLDAAGAVATAFIGPGRPPLHVDPLVVTNHQEHQATEQFAKLSHSRDREVAMRAVLEADGDEERAIRAFLEPPTYNRNFDHSFGTLYTAVMRPAERCVDYRWPSSVWRQSFDAFEPGERTVELHT